MAREQAEMMARHIAQSGFNMVRLHGIDLPRAVTGRGIPDSIMEVKDGKLGLHKANLDLLDYFVFQLKRHGIYIALDLLTWREFSEEEGIVRKEGEGSHHVNQAALTDPLMIRLQKDYAAQLFGHLNPYTGLKWKDDPVFAAISLINERGIISYDGLTPHYMGPFKRRWNDWLLEQYKTRENLAKTWTSNEGICDLRKYQDPAEGTVPLPVIAEVKTWDRPYTTGMLKTKEYVPDEIEPYVKYYSRMGSQGIPSTSDMLRFCHHMQIEYECGMRDFLRDLGVKIPVVGAATGKLPASLKGKAEMDFIDAHIYWDVTRYEENVSRNANKAMVRDDPYDYLHGERSTVGSLAARRVWGCPMADLEWGHQFPNEYRTEGQLFMGAYACFQDWDMLLCHGYVYKNMGFVKKEMKQIPPFPDPARIAPLRIATLLFQRFDVKKAYNRIALGFSNIDTFYHQSWQCSNNLHPGPWAVGLSGMGTAFFEKEYGGDADVVFSSGRSSAASYRKARHAIVLADNPWDNPYNHGTPDRLRPLREINPELGFRRDVVTTWSFESLGITEVVTGKAQHAIDIATIPRRSTPFGVSPDKKLCLGYIGPRFCLISDVRLPIERIPSFLFHVYVRAAGKWSLRGAENYVDEAFVSDTGELKWDVKEGVFTVDTANTKGVVGFIGGKSIKLTGVACDVENEFCHVGISSLDGKALRDSSRILVVAVGRVENTGQYWMNRARTRLDGTWHVGFGTAPVLIDPIEGRLTLERNSSADGVGIYALDGAGKRVKDVAFEVAGKDVSFDIGRPYETIYYEICDGVKAAQ